MERFLDFLCFIDQKIVIISVLDHERRIETIFNILFQTKSYLHTFMMCITSGPDVQMDLRS